MAETFKFPNGYDVPVYRKQDILKAIDDNIIDKEIALSIVEQCETDAIDFLNKGVWAGIPFMGNIKANEFARSMQDEDIKKLIEAAETTLKNKEYILFRKQLNKNKADKIKLERVYKYVTSIAINTNKILYKRIVREKGELYARIHFYINKAINKANLKFDENGEPIYLDFE